MEPFNYTKRSLIVEKVYYNVKCYITVFDKVLSIHLWCFFFILGVLIYLLQKVHIFYVNFAYFMLYFF